MNKHRDQKDQQRQQDRVTRSDHFPGDQSGAEHQQEIADQQRRQHDQVCDPLTDDAVGVERAVLQHRVCHAQRRQDEERHRRRRVERDRRRTHYRAQREVEQPDRRDRQRQQHADQDRIHLIAHRDQRGAAAPTQQNADENDQPADRRQRREPIRRHRRLWRCRIHVDREDQRRDQQRRDQRQELNSRTAIDHRQLEREQKRRHHERAAAQTGRNNPKWRHREGRIQVEQTGAKDADHQANDGDHLRGRLEAPQRDQQDADGNRNHAGHVRHDEIGEEIGVGEAHQRKLHDTACPAVLNRAADLRPDLLHRSADRKAFKAHADGVAGTERAQQRSELGVGLLVSGREGLAVDGGDVIAALQTHAQARPAPGIDRHAAVNRQRPRHQRADKRLAAPLKGLGKIQDRRDHHDNCGRGGQPETDASFRPLRDWLNPAAGGDLARVGCRAHEAALIP